MLGSADHPLRLAIVGSGPSGFYAAEELLQSQYAVEVTMVERLPVPFGLVRSGVAPDHPKLKQPILVYDRIARKHAFHYFGNVHVGRDVSVEDLLATHHGVIFAYGAEVDHGLGISGQDLAGSHSATEFVGWYNGHPDYRALRFDLSHQTVAIIGQGNVALDVARILAKPVDALRKTDIAEHALDALAESRIEDIHIFGRRGPTQAKFTPQELGEFASIPGCATACDPKDLELNEASRIEAEDKRSRNIAKNLELFRTFAKPTRPKALRCCWFHFLRRPIAILGGSRVEALRLIRTSLSGEPFQQIAQDTDHPMDFPCELVFRSIGYRGKPIAGLPFDASLGVLRHLAGRLVDESGKPLYGLYATGWIKRGANGIIGTNRGDSVATVATLLADLPHLDQSEKPGSSGLSARLSGRGNTYLTYEDWQRIDQVEVFRGQAKGKPREKMTQVAEMLAARSGE